MRTDAERWYQEFVTYSALYHRAQGQLETLRAARCATCTHWIPDDRSIGGTPGTGTCWLTEYTMRPRGQETKAGTKAWAADASGYYAILNTEADFGCVQWAPSTHANPE